MSDESETAMDPRAGLSPENLALVRRVARSAAVMRAGETHTFLSGHPPVIGIREDDLNALMDAARAEGRECAAASKSLAPR